MSDQEIDLVNRDPNEMNNHIQVMFDDVLAEPEGAHSSDCVWRNSYKCFSCGKNQCYKILTFIFGIPLALFWGCMFACVSFCQIWIIMPKIRCLHVTLHSIRKILSILLSSILGPIIETYALIFSRIHITQSTGEPPKPIGELPGNPPSKSSNIRPFN